MKRKIYKTVGQIFFKIVFYYLVWADGKGPGLKKIMYLLKEPTNAAGLSSSSSFFLKYFLDQNQSLDLICK